jgi:hypothetical protein
MQSKIRAIPDDVGYATADAGYELAYRNAVVDFTNGKFRIVSGSVGEYYTGTERSSVRVQADGVDTLFATLGFDLGVNSETIASQAPTEVLLSANYNAVVGDASVSVDAGLGVSVGDALAITDGTNTDYFLALAGSSDTSIVVVSGTISNSYTADEAKVQLLKMQDPESLPRAYYETVDAISRWGIMSVSNQIDFSS